MPRISGVGEALNPALRIVPAEKSSYVDCIQLWLKDPLPPTRLEWLATQCDSVDVRQQRKRWDPAYRVRLQVRRFSQEALQWLATLSGALLNYVEVGLDWTFNNERERDEAHEFVRRHHIKRWHGDQQVTVYKSTRYTARRRVRRVPNMLVVYSDLPCRVSGEVNCVHLEWRLSGARTLQRAGLSTFGELLQLDHRAFWKERLLMRTVNQQALGHQYNMHVLGRDRRRGPWIEFYGAAKSLAYDFDGRAGYMLMRRAGDTTQGVADSYGKLFDVSRCLVPLDVDELLPAGSGIDNDSRGVELVQGNQWVRWGKSVLSP
jgi:hypothetical protein